MEEGKLVYSSLLIVCRFFINRFSVGFFPASSMEGKSFIEWTLKIRSTRARASFLTKLHAEACNFIKKGTLAQVFSCEFCEISNSTFFTEHLGRLLLKVCKKNILTFLAFVCSSYHDHELWWDLNLSLFSQCHYQ